MLLEQACVDDLVKSRLLRRIWVRGVFCLLLVEQRVELEGKVPKDFSKESIFSVH